MIHKPTLYRVGKNWFVARSRGRRRSPVFGYGRTEAQAYEDWQRIAKPDDTMEDEVMRLSGLRYDGGRVRCVETYGVFAAR